MDIGLVSVTFRQLPPEEIVRLCRQAGLDGIEWGGDIHVPPGDLETARQVGAVTASQGLRVLAYGSYYRLGAGSDPQRDFAPVLTSARALGAPLSRVWPGDRGSAAADEAYYKAAAAETRIICGMAGEYGIRVAYEYHPGTLTDCIDSARRLLDLCGGCGIRSLWQPRVIPAEENLKELEQMDGRLAHIHVFHWVKREGQTLRLPLAQGAADWKQYLAAAARIPGGHGLLLEFVPGDSPEQFIADARTLRRWAGR